MKTSVEASGNFSLASFGSTCREVSIDSFALAACFSASSFSLFSSSSFFNCSSFSAFSIISFCSRYHQELKKDYKKLSTIS
jgi:hypothetical protein